jgi:D-alanyl-lipoteichoic acid acyltransferase DltB (MBOAT superfamily)
LAIRQEFELGQTMDGVHRILRGLLKKALFADMLAFRLIDRVFEDPASYGSLMVLCAIYGYAIQIYADFSGYTDIALGSCKVLGYRLPENFNYPYLATDLRDFWRRWHISLSTWLRDYLYIPLGGSRISPQRTQINLLATMLLGGLWHGANWTFVTWGAIHGGMLALNRHLQRRAEERGLGPSQWPVWVRRLATFQNVCLAWVFFRAPDFSSAAEMLTVLAEGSLRIAVGPAGLLLMALGLFSHFAHGPWKQHLVRRFLDSPTIAQAGVAVAVVCIVAYCSLAARPFIYFQF